MLGDGLSWLEKLVMQSFWIWSLKIREKKANMKSRSCMYIKTWIEGYEVRIIGVGNMSECLRMGSKGGYAVF